MSLNNNNYSAGNLVAFNYAGFACISIVVFLSSTQPFYLSEVLGINIDDKIGSTIGTLGFADELTAIISAPLIGTLVDKINSKGISGTKLIQSLSFLVIAISLIGYGTLSSNVIPDLIFFRCLFALGVTSCMSLVTVLLNELSNSDFSFRKFVFWKTVPDLQYQTDITPTTNRRNGKYAALIGISTGLGAIFAVSNFLTLPIKLVNWYPSWTLKDGLKTSYNLIAGYAFLSFLLLHIFLYDKNKQINQISHDELLGDNDDDNEDNNIKLKPSYFELLQRGIELSKENHKVQLSYVGAFVARSTTVATSVFIPLIVYNYYYKQKLCDVTEYPNKKNCYDGYIFAAILTGVAQTVALISAPVWGYLIDLKSVGKFKTFLFSGVIGLIGNYGLCLTSSGEELYDPHTFGCFMMVSLIGISQIGIIITSMSLLSTSSEDPNHMGSLSGLYSLSGGLGILIITKLGGMLSDSWILAPFFILGTFNLILIVLCLIWNRDENNDYRRLDD
ncbi:major facilitator superfamily domain-containing protein [Scheffersomyces amazonensis]|uniref:major facilitator superfamily domain-containing protein n=1 Tax=Scheffersomyces amazonensis TaxID=1078765 RepID=UPI00315CADD7